MCNHLCCSCLQIDKKAMHKAGMVQRVTNEVEIHCRLKHPSILEVMLAGHISFLVSVYSGFFITLHKVNMHIFVTLQLQLPLSPLPKKPSALFYCCHGYLSCCKLALPPVMTLFSILVTVFHFTLELVTLVCLV